MDRFVESARRSPDTHVWIVGNEPNFTIRGPWPGSHEGYIQPYVEPFVDAYARIRPAVHALPGDGTGRDHGLEGKSALLADHRRAIEHTWTSVACGAAPVDAGTALGDAGSTLPSIDAGSAPPARDAGAIAPDASPADGTGPRADAGPSGGGLRRGCGCGVGARTGSPIALAVLALSLVSARRRRAG